MTNATVKPIAAPLDSKQREEQSNDIAELLSVLADLAVRVRGECERVDGLASKGDKRVREAAKHLAALERHARDVHSEAASVHNELLHARLI